MFPPKGVSTNLNECFQAAMAYVILSRIADILQLFLKEFDQAKIYCNTLAKAEALKLRARAINFQETEWNTAKPGIVRICTINANSLQKHYKDLIKDEFIIQSDIICIQESWLEEDLKDPINSFHHFYVHGRSKGITLMSRTKPLYVVPFQSENCSILKATYYDFEIMNLYRFASSTNINQFTTDVLSHLDTSKTTVILTDSNLDYLKSPGNHFSSSLNTMGFQQMITKPTHELGGLLDQVYFYSPCQEASCKLYKAHSLFWSDHTCQAVILSTSPLLPDSTERRKKYSECLESAVDFPQAFQSRHKG